jgi:cbb3-type cytochrome oxidase subunit 3
LDATTTTPLPSTWLMLLSGFVGLGFFAYRGTKKNAAAIAA